MQRETGCYVNMFLMVEADRNSKEKVPYFKKNFSLFLTDLRFEAIERQFEIYFWDLYWLDQSTPRFCWPRTDNSKQALTEGRDMFILNVHIKKIGKSKAEEPCQSH